MKQKALLSIEMIAGLVGVVLYFILGRTVPLLRFLGCTITRGQAAVIIQYTLIAQVIVAFVMCAVGLLWGFRKKNNSGISRLCVVSVYLLPMAHMGASFFIMLYIALQRS